MGRVVPTDCTRRLLRSSYAPLSAWRSPQTNHKTAIRLSSTPPNRAARRIHSASTPPIIIAMNNYSFLDSNGQHQARPPPSPSQSSVAGSQVNGGQANGIPMVNGLPSGGQQTDMNHLWSVVQQLSQLLEENKAQTQGIVNGVAAIQGRAAEEGGGAVGMGMREVNGEINGTNRCMRYL